ncbi:PspA-associated protein PspAA [Kitasatospora sp. NPDC051914]|uniref:PspA-associated protein PspAA n=1 Tax=unclassified Kitasatospora TaxID=2633591 RepID=UPI003440ABE9
MIMRVMGEGQFEVGESHLNRLNELDDELLKAVESGDDEKFRAALEGLLGAVKEFGSPLPDDSLEPSDLILPDVEATIAEVREMLRGEGDGLIPGLPE